jgi:hypothetical protein
VKRRSLAWGGALGAAAYLTFRIGMESALRGAGARTSGLLSYDAYYPLAFARQLAREDHWLLFNNPYGTLDSQPGLYDGLATLLRALGPLWQGDLYAFDLVFGAVCAFGAGWLFTAICFRVSRQTRLVTALVIVLVICGGGIGFIAERAALVDRHHPLWGAMWGLSWTLNQLLIWEVLYHLLFWAGVWAVVSGRFAATVAVAVALAAVHPFTFAVFALFIGCWWVAHLALRAPGHRRIALRLVLPAAAIAVAGALVYEVLLPGGSADAEFMRTVYKRFHYTVPLGDLALFAAPALGVLTAVVLLGRRERAERGDSRSAAAAAFLLAAAVLLAFALSRHVTHAVPQPAHWTRVYLVAFVALGALALPPVAAERRRALAGTVMALLAIALADTVLARPVIRDELLLLGTPVVMDRDSAHLIAILRDLPPRHLVYVRSCRTAGQPPSLEYAVSALTPQQPPYGHFAFSPFLPDREAQFTLCGAGAKPPPIRPEDWVVTDRGLSPRLRLRDVRPVGRYELGVSRAG